MPIEPPPSQSSPTLALSSPQPPAVVENGAAPIDLAQELASLQTLLLNSAAIPLSPYALVDRRQLLQQIVQIQLILTKSNHGSLPSSPASTDSDPGAMLAHLQQTYEAAANSLAQRYATELADQAAQTSLYQDQVTFLRTVLDRVIQEPLVMPQPAIVPDESI